MTVWLVVNFTTYLEYRAFNGGIISQQLMGKNVEGNKCGTTMLLSQNLPPETEEIHQNISIKTTDVTAEIRIEHLPNMSLQHYCGTKMPGGLIEGKIKKR